MENSSISSYTNTDIHRYWGPSLSPFKTKQRSTNIHQEWGLFPVCPITSFPGSICMALLKTECWISFDLNQEGSSYVYIISVDSFHSCGKACIFSPGTKYERSKNVMPQTLSIVLTARTICAQKAQTNDCKSLYTKIVLITVLLGGSFISGWGMTEHRRP